jgi:hypothetical protein
MIVCKQIRSGTVMLSCVILRLVYPTSGVTSAPSVEFFTVRANTVPIAACAQ